MKQASEKDLYSILGVSPKATEKEIRDAYLARTRVIHPDRFDQNRQQKEWLKANEMLAELNEAYSVLRNNDKRREYDNHHRRTQQQKTSKTRRSPHKSNAPPPYFEVGEMTPGQVLFGNLPEKNQSRLLKRQKNKEVDQYRVKLSSTFWNYVFIFILLCWYLFLFVDADGAKWQRDTLLWYSGITVVVGILIGRNSITIFRWFKSSLKYYFYITPIYFLKTEYDIISYRPIWMLKDVEVTHNYRNGFYQDSDVVLKFDDYNESLTLSSTKQVESLFNKIKTYDNRLREAYAKRDRTYFINNDDFYKVPRSEIKDTESIAKYTRISIYLISVIICLISLLIAIVANNKLSQKLWIKHSVPNVYMENPTPNNVTPSYPEQILPYTGSVQTWVAVERIAPFEIKAAQGSHHLLKLVNTFTDEPTMTIFVRSGTTVEVDVPLGTYEVRYASGGTWYGYEYLFGPGTTYSRADKTFTFEIIENQISGYTITLYRVADGNLHTSTIRPTDF